MSAEWQDIEKFAAQIGEPPSPGARVWRIDRTRPWGPDNFRWKHSKMVGDKRHPLSQTWLVRKRQGRLAPVWADDFERFCVDVGERPSHRHDLVEADKSMKMGPSNFMWKEPLVPPHIQFGTEEYRAAYKAATKTSVQDKRYKRHYGLSLEEYNSMSAKQNHACAICGEREQVVTRGDGAAKLSVDHCHKSGKIRGLLCMYCNTGIGKLRDDPALLRAAADYIERNTP